MSIMPIWSNIGARPALRHPDTRKLDRMATHVWHLWLEFALSDDGLGESRRAPPRRTVQVASVQPMLVPIHLPTPPYCT